MCTPTQEQTRFSIILDAGISTSPFGFATAEILDGGCVIALAHPEHAGAVLEALRVATGEF